MMTEGALRQGVDGANDKWPYLVLRVARRQGRAGSKQQPTYLPVPELFAGVCIPLLRLLCEAARSALKVRLGTLRTSSNIWGSYVRTSQSTSHLADIVCALLDTTRLRHSLSALRMLQ